MICDILKLSVTGAIPCRPQNSSINPVVAGLPSDRRAQVLSQVRTLVIERTEPIELPYTAIAVILACTATHLKRHLVVTRERRFSPSRAILSGGLLLVLAFALGGSLPLLRARPAEALREL